MYRLYWEQVYPPRNGGAGFEGLAWFDERWNMALREKETMNRARRMLGEGTAIFEYSLCYSRGTRINNKYKWFERRK
jgi:hypothetical protein